MIFHNSVLAILVKLSKWILILNSDYRAKENNKSYVSSVLGRACGKR
jgi:hypothetical protein